MNITSLRTQLLPLNHTPRTVIEYPSGHKLYCLVYYALGYARSYGFIAYNALRLEAATCTVVPLPIESMRGTGRTVSLARQPRARDYRTVATRGHSNKVT